MLTDQEYLRYGASTCLGTFGEAEQLKLKHARVVVIGLGGLGCAASQYLAAAGAGTLMLVDDDTVQLSNLQRQVLYTTYQVGTAKARNAARSLAQLNNTIDIQAKTLRVDEDNVHELIGDSNVVLDCTDNLASRWVINKACYQAKIPLVTGAAEGMQGQLLSLEPSHSHGCYACLYPPVTEERPSCERVGVLGPLVGIIGAYQAFQAIRALTGQTTDWGVLHTFDGTRMTWSRFFLPASVDCSHCQESLCKFQ
ncbi:HesA/MoeB/ThiF family protein [Alteromonas halophila]|uniref:Molybdopterin biosynthesis protein MoeB n=1 Tax=Alteromonas halophila TaxID=516698 RepID=A0A918JL16_9ALTE|nr:HesA/MoeB/ThiF family protein [Alteromonas halophila]GGW81152.1 molybdopterin biosynthesis protein MoeB [Alteromonas halophila]